MNKILNKIAFAMLTVFWLTSFVGCKEDLSSMDDMKLPDITVDTTGQRTLTVFQFDKLQVNPKVIEKDLNGHTLSYKWLINLEPRSLELIEIGDTKTLEYEVSFPPTVSGYEHRLVLEITDENTGIVYYQDWPVVIRNSIGEGLVIAETYDGVNTDISHVMSPLVTPEYDDEKIRHKVYSGVNGAPISGLVNYMMYTSFGRDRVMLAATPNSLFTINTLDYQLGLRNEKLFYAEQPNYGAAYMISINNAQNDIIVHDGKIFVSWLQLTRFGLPATSSYHVPDAVAINADAYAPQNIRMSFYSEEQAHFVYQQSFNSFGDRTMRPVPPSAGPFDATHVPNKTVVAAGVNKLGDFIHVLKDKTTDRYGLYILDGGDYDDVNWVVLPPKAKQYVDLSAAPEIDQATHFVILDNQSVLLYATKTKIYAVMYAASTPSYGLRYTAASGEEITTLRMYHQADYPKEYRTYFARNNKQLVLSTYNGTEGKVHILPLINEGIANIDLPNAKTYSGFGKILFTSTQL